MGPAQVGTCRQHSADAAGDDPPRLCEPKDGAQPVVIDDRHRHRHRHRTRLSQSCLEVEDALVGSMPGFRRRGLRLLLHTKAAHFLPATHV